MKFITTISLLLVLGLSSCYIAVPVRHYRYSGYSHYREHSEYDNNQSSSKNGYGSYRQQSQQPSVWKLSLSRDEHTSKEKDHFQKVANMFADSVGVLLRANYPSKVVSVGVDLTNRNGTLTLTYTVSAQRCQPSQAERHFDHRGALSVSATASAAKADALTRATAQWTHLEQMGYLGIEASDNNAIPYKGKYYAVHEFFFAYR